MTINNIAYISMPVSFILSFCGSMLPALIEKQTKSTDLTNSFAFSGLAGFSGGILIAVAYVHSFYDATNAFNQLIQNNVIPEFGWAGLFAMIGSISTLLLELILTFLIHYFRALKLSNASSVTASTPLLSSSSSSSSSSNKQNNEISLSSNNENNIDFKDEHEHHHLHHHEHEHQLEFKAGDPLWFLIVDMIILLIGLSFHSFFVGLSLGMTNNNITLFVAIIAHQFFEALSLGGMIVLTRVRYLYVFIIDLVFSSVTPIGTICGIILLNNIVDYNVYYFLEGIFSAFSAGILIYVGFQHLILEEIERIQARKDHKNYALRLFSLSIGMIIGCLFLTLIGIWA